MTEHGRHGGGAIRVPEGPNACHPWRVRWFGVGVLALLVVNCGRTGLDPYDLEEEAIESGGTTGNPRNVPPIQSDAGVDAEVPDAEVPDAEIPDAEIPDAEIPDAETPDATVVPPDPVDPGPDPCRPATETCNGKDDDCNGVVDEIPPDACPGGGARYCIAGAMSACPRACEVCRPGGVAICQHSICTFWGERECAADGQSFGSCRERPVPSECAEVARKHQASPELERCCLDHGYCCIDMFDFDADGNQTEFIGNCDALRCD